MMLVLALVAAVAIAVVPLAFVLGTGVGLAQARDAYDAGNRPPSAQHNARVLGRVGVTAAVLLSAAVVVGLVLGEWYTS